jgi:hypothetical protein
MGTGHQPDRPVRQKAGKRSSHRDLGGMDPDSGRNNRMLAGDRRGQTAGGLLAVVSAEENPDHGAQKLRWRWRR